MVSFWNAYDIIIIIIMSGLPRDQGSLISFHTVLSEGPAIILLSYIPGTPVASNLLNLILLPVRP